MLAGQLLSGRLFPLKISDSCGKALDLMNEFDIAFLPVVDGDKHLGYASASDLLDADPDDNILTKTNSAVVSKVYENQHLFDIITIFSEISSSVVSVVDINDRFLGILSAKELINKMASLNAFSQPGSIITLELPAISYSMSEISRIVEYNNTKILSLYVNTVEDAPAQLQVHIKLNTTDIKSVVATFERYGYTIVASYYREYDTEDMKNRFDSLMKYLDI
ncbi:MAG: CBS domain-containing protein [Bacteroidetes bacterium]|nr:MAG: CBS domain-containing protein [Bacteroidota bacterium]